MNLKRLKYFVKIVDVGNMTQAADVLHIAQPALSQQLATLETEMGKQLVVRSSRGMVATDAGKTLYRHAQLILRQCEHARRDVNQGGDGPSGHVILGLSPGTAGTSLALPMIREVRLRFPRIVLSINESYGTIFSEQVMSGRIDMAVMFGGDRNIHGLSLTPILRERMYLVAPSFDAPPGSTVRLKALAGIDLFLPRKYNTARQLLDEAFAAVELQPTVIGEIESIGTLKSAIATGLGAAVVPGSVARDIAAGEPDVVVRRVVEPDITIPVCVAVSSHLPFSKPAEAVHAILRERVDAMAEAHAALEAASVD